MKLAGGWLGMVVARVAGRGGPLLVQLPPDMQRDVRFTFFLDRLPQWMEVDMLQVAGAQIPGGRRF